MSNTVNQMPLARTRLTAYALIPKYIGRIVVNEHGWFRLVTASGIINFMDGRIVDNPSNDITEYELVPKGTQVTIVAGE